VHIGESLEFLSALNWIHELNLDLIDFEPDSKWWWIVFSLKGRNWQFGDIMSLVADSWVWWYHSYIWNHLFFHLCKF